MAESAADRTKRAKKILAKLKAEYPNAHCALDHRTPFELLAATILSAQCTDVRGPRMSRTWSGPPDSSGTRPRA